MSCILLAVVWFGMLASVIWFLNIGSFTLLLFAGGIIAVATIIALAEEFNEWRRRRRALQRQLLPPVA
jgi:ribose/xylose/arabinose/galactoside ABC-type transport system permease subunit